MKNSIITKIDNGKIIHKCRECSKYKEYNNWMGGIMAKWGSWCQYNEKEKMIFLDEINGKINSDIQLDFPEDCPLENLKEEV
jgi:hypothetical protein